MVEPGLTLVDAMAGPLNAAGIRGGAVDLSGLHLAPFAYVIPAQSPDANHVAYYSATHRAPSVHVESGTATFGQRDGAPFLHAHALWHGVGGAAAGHILPLDTRVAEPCQVRAWGVAEAEMIALPDPETNFTLFGPAQLDAASAGGNCVLGRLRPNEDLVLGIEELCRRHGAAGATIRSGIGSTIGSLLEGGDRVDTVPTEFFIRHGAVLPDATGRPRAEIEIVLVDEAGAMITGRPVRGMNPVLICAEIVLVLG
jgi:predicted DNA-binding protein with PD1-like motif